MHKRKKLSNLLCVATMLKTREGTTMTMEGVCPFLLPMLPFCPFLFLVMVLFFLSFILRAHPLMTMAKVVVVTTLL